MSRLHMVPQAIIDMVSSLNPLVETKHNLNLVDIKLQQLEETRKFIEHALNNYKRGKNE